MKIRSEHWLGGRRSISLVWVRHSRGDVSASRVLIRTMNPYVHGIARMLSKNPEVVSAVCEVGYKEVRRGVMRLDVEPKYGFMSYWGGNVYRAMLLEKRAVLAKLNENNLRRVV